MSVFHCECPNCHRKVLTEYRFCPYCGSQLLRVFDGVLLAKLFGQVEARSGVHGSAQARLWDLGQELGLHSLAEYCVPDLTQKGRTSYIDVVWKSNIETEFAFEIRAKARNMNLVTTRKDTNKLQNLKAKRKFVVNVSEVTGEAVFHEIFGKPAEPFIIEKARSEPYVPSEVKAYSVKEIRKNFAKAYAIWTDQEDLELAAGYKEGLSVAQLATKHQRKTGAIKSRLRKLCLVQ